SRSPAAPRPRSGSARGSPPRSRARRSPAVWTYRSRRRSRRAPRREGAPEGVGPRVPGRADRADRDTSRVVGVRGQFDPEPLVREELGNGVAPLDEQHALAVLELVEREVDDILLPL